MRPHRFIPHVDGLEVRCLMATVPIESIPEVPTLTYSLQHNLRSIYEHGQQLGNRDGTFIKVGDSHSTNQISTLDDLGQPSYNPQSNGLVNQPDLVSAWQHYRTPIAGGNSYARESTAVALGQPSAFGVSRAASEAAVVQPTIAFIQLGHNDLFQGIPFDQYRANMRSIVQQMISRGIIPVLITNTKMIYAPQATRDSTVASIDQILADIADEFDIPLLNIMPTIEHLPHRGADRAGVHLNASPYGGGNFTAPSLGFGNNARNLAILKMLSWIDQNIIAKPSVSDGRLQSAPNGIALTPSQSVIATGSARGESPRVTVFDATTNAPIGEIIAYDSSMRAGVRVAVGDVTGDGIVDIVTVPERGSASHVRIFSGSDGSDRGSFFAFDAGFTGGISLAIGDVDGDGIGEIIVGAGEDGGPIVKVFDARTGTLRGSTLAYESSFRGGVQVASGDVDADGRDEILTIPLSGGGPVAVVLDGMTLESRKRGFVADPNARVDWSIAAADVDGDGRAEAIVAAGAGGAPAISMVNLDTFASVAAFYTDDPNARNGVRVTTVEVDHHPEIVSLSTAGTRTTIRRFRAMDQAIVAEIAFRESGLLGAVAISAG